MMSELRCGLLGAKLGHSYSPQIHSLLGEYSYRLYEKQPEELADFLRHGAWDGLNVTIPYKKAVVPFCDHLSELAERTGSVNTLVKDADGTIRGDNTDAYGFSCMLQELGVDPQDKKTLILGNGGACASVKAVLEMANARTVVISRNGEDHYGNLDRHRDAALIVNTTPVGMYPDNGNTPVDLGIFPELQGVLDIIYNPFRTALVMQAEERFIPWGSGLRMLVAQAVRSSELFTGTKIPESRIEEVVKILSFDMRNVILIGMPGCGKSTIASLLGRITGKQVLELDEMFSRKFRISPADCIRSQGEPAFRKMETEVIREAGKQSGKIISTGGGCVTAAENAPLLRQNGILVWIRRDIHKLPVQGRPLSQQGSLQDLYDKRRGMYEAFADLTVENDRTPADTAKHILEMIR